MSQGFIGEQLGSFRLEEVIGSGAMGVVFRATQEIVDPNSSAADAEGRKVVATRKAAVKIVQGEIAENTKLLERFSREAEIIKQFRHPNIVRWLATGKFRGTYYFAMEFVEGVTLEKLLLDRGAIPWREVVDLAIQICDALHYAHQQGVVHRDLKPSNLMVTRDGRIKLTDFGIARVLDRTALTAPGRTLGTAAYMAPEQIRGTPAVSHKTDLYSLGVVLYQMLTGKPPFEGASAVVLMHCHLNEPPPRPSDKVQEIPKALNDLVVALMSKNPTSRPWDAEAAGVILTELRDKAARSEAVPMVWPAADSPDANPSRAGVGVTPPPARPKKKGKKSGGTSGSNLRSDETSWTDAVLSRVSLETIGLIAALFAIGGFMAYWLWPPSAQYLYRQAVPLMESSRRSDWLTALEEYIDPLDTKHPNHPYHAQTQAWRDAIALDEAESRSKMLASAIATPFSEPKTNGERQYVGSFSLATKAAAAGHEDLAAKYWREMTGTLNVDDPDERKWILLSQKRAEELETKIRERRAFVEDQLRKADAAFRGGRPNEAITIHAMLKEKFAQYADLADLLAPAPLPEAPSEPTPPAHVPAPEVEKPAASPTATPAPTAEPETEPEPAKSVPDPAPAQPGRRGRPAP
ncbi:MAG: protein kinase [Paludisphaera borealis]|uniref:serine/threonine-protein kinase n=1 Tax=Paludisphaera borealis TaxID=1387353 RepID=UPI002849CD62|nr:protein kinase [Paludisphaera borealis]MDR3620238.1 protein kinase [Paludisphaera borealis]